MKRALYEWSAIGFLSAVVALMILAVASVNSGPSGIELVLQPMALETRCSGGMVVFSDCLVNQDLLDGWIDELIEPTVVRDLHLPIPGFAFRRTTFSDGSVSWYLRLSLVIPILLLSLLSVLSWKRYLASRPKTRRRVDAAD